MANNSFSKRLSNYYGWYTCGFFVFLIAATVILSSTAVAQSAGGDRTGIQRRNLISANPIGLLFEWYNGEYERAVSSTASLAVAGSTFDFWDGNQRYTAVDAIARYYPQARALRGQRGVEALTLGVKALQHGQALGHAFDEVCLGDGEAAHGEG